MLKIYNNKGTKWVNIIFLLAIIVLAGNSYAGETSSEDSSFAVLPAKELVETIKTGHCIILYEVSTQPLHTGEKAKSIMSTTNHRMIDDVMKAVAAFKERISSSVKLYRITVKDMPWAPAFVTYDLSGKEVSRISGPFRADALPWLVHEILGYYTHSIPTDKGEFLRAGWMANNTNASYVNVVNVRKEEVELYGKTDTVQIVNYSSTPSGETSFAIERTFAGDGRTVSSIETYGVIGKFGYFDYDRTGKFQYRVRYQSGEGK